MDESFDPDIKILEIFNSPGMGIQGLLQGDDGDFRMAIGNQRFMETIGVSAKSKLLLSDGLLTCPSTVFISVNNDLAGFVQYTDEVKADARTTVASLRSQGLNVGLMTGDTIASARKLAGTVGISPEWVWSGQKPIDKARMLEEVGVRHGPVAMVGDNLNDIPALSSASFSICVSGDSEVSSAVGGDAQLFPPSSSSSSDLMRIPFLLGLAKETLKKIRENLIWAIGYNVIALLLSSGVLTLIHPSLVLTP